MKQKQDTNKQKLHKTIGQLIFAVEQQEKKKPIKSNFNWPQSPKYGW